MASRGVVWRVDAVPGTQPMADVDPGGVAGAIFLSTFVMIGQTGQNRQAAFQQSRADHDFETQGLELKTNTELTRQIHVLTEELHRRLIRPA
jgi:hypothetical protein